MLVCVLWLSALASMWCVQADQEGEVACLSGACDADESPLLQLPQRKKAERVLTSEQEQPSPQRKKAERVLTSEQEQPSPIASDGSALGASASPERVLSSEQEQHGPIASGGSALGASAPLIAHMLKPSKNESCQPDVLECLSSDTYRAACPEMCDPFYALAQAASEGDEQAMVKEVGKLVDTGMQALGLGSLLQGVSIDVPSCPPCPSVSCCLTMPATLLEAFLIQGGLYPKKTKDPTTSMFTTFAGDVDESENDTFEGSAANKYYRDTIAFYGGEGAMAFDVGWTNSLLANLGMYFPFGTQKGIHAYRRVPTTPQGTLNFEYSVSRMPEPSSAGTALKIGILADWGCGNAAARKVMEELKKQSPDVVIHLGDTYYSGTREEQEEYFYGLAREILGPKIPILTVPGNHDYYSGGQGFLDIIDKLAGEQEVKQEASYFALQGDHFQFIGLDTGILDSFNIEQVAGAIPGNKDWKSYTQQTMPFIPDDQLEWALEHIRSGQRKGLKTIMLSHHQLFSRHSQIGFANGGMAEKAYGLDTKADVYTTSQWSKTSTKLPGGLAPDDMPTTNTRLLDQFSSVLGPQATTNLTAWFWGHEHGMTLFEPYAGLDKGRLIGNGCIPVPKATIDDPYSESGSNGTHWGGNATVINGTKVKQGDRFWAMGFVTLELTGAKGKAKYWQLTDKTASGSGIATWSEAEVLHEEDL